MHGWLPWVAVVSSISLYPWGSWLFLIVYGQVFKSSYMLNIPSAQIGHCCSFLVFVIQLAISLWCLACHMLIVCVIPSLTHIHPEIIVAVCFSNAVSPSIKAFWKTDFTARSKSLCQSLLHRAFFGTYSGFRHRQPHRYARRPFSQTYPTSLSHADPPVLPYSSEAPRAGLEPGVKWTHAVPVPQQWLGISATVCFKSTVTCNPLFRDWEREFGMQRLFSLSAKGSSAIGKKWQGERSEEMAVQCGNRLRTV